MKTYQVQTWDEEGALKNNYQVSIQTGAELAHLKKFLRQKSAHVVITPVRPAAKKRGKS